MTLEARERVSFSIGVLVSFVSHLILAAIVILLIERSSFGSTEPNVVFSVTLEGGERLGGINQAPEPDFQQPKVLPNQQEQTAEESAVEEETSTPKDIEKPTVTEDRTAEIEAARLAEAKRLKEQEKLREQEKLKKQQEEKKKKLEEEKKKKAEEDKKKAADEKKKAEEEKKKKAAEKKARDAELQKAVQKAAKRYAGESANAGGQGFGAAALGGKGMGGGQLQSLEFVAYRNQLEAHIKSGWRWLPSPQRYRAVVSVFIMEDGRIQDVRIETSSGNPSFDDSVLRAVQKASPVPPAPPALYQQFFREIRMTFDSQE